MPSFLKLVARDIYNRFGDNLSEITVILPTKRPEFYFYQYLSECSQKTLLAPKILSINDILSEWSGMTIADNFELTYRLYLAYRQVIKTDESFDKFLFWGNLILSDFNDIDCNLADPEKIFAHITHQHQLNDLFSDEQLLEPVKQFWGAIYDNNPTILKERFVYFWTKLLPIYNTFVSDLLKDNIAYRGLAYRKVVNETRQKTFKVPATPIAIIGFDYFNQTEIEIFKYLQSNVKTLFYWDYDVAYTHLNTEAGEYISRNKLQFPSALPDDYFNNYQNSKQVTIIDAPGLTAQAQAIAKQIEKLGALDNQNPDFTAVVLANKQLLLPTLNSFPPVNNLNITIGWPAVYSNTALFIQHLCDIWLHSSIYNNYTRYSTQIVKKILAHNWITPEIREVIENLYNEQPFFTIENEIPSPFASQILPQQLNQPLNHIIELLQQKLSELSASDENMQRHIDKIEEEVVYKLLTIFVQLRNVYNRFSLTLENSTQVLLIQQIIRNTSVPFESAPLSGIQITGLPETCSLDFKNLIIAGANEGVLPSVSSGISYIPYSIRKAFNIPTFEHQINKAAYLTYRLMQRANNIFFIYNSEENEINNIEVSRFVQQLEIEQPWKFIRQSFVYKHTTKPVKHLSFPWTPKVEEFMRQYANETTQYLSPSAINTYIDCPLKFYLQYCTGIKAPQTVESTIDSRVFGNILHKSIEMFYNSPKSSLLNKEIHAIDLKNRSKYLDTIINTIYEDIKEIDQKSGYNILYKDIVKEYLSQIIAIDTAYAPFTMLGSELHVKAQIELPQRNIQVTLGGTIDRIDMKNNTIRILDYKTGNPKAEISKIDKIFIPKLDRPKEALQAFLYACIFKKLNPAYRSCIFNAGLIVSRKVYKNGFLLFNDKKETISLENIETEFIEHLQNSLSQMFDSSIEFSQAENADNCKYCQYKQMCKRSK